MGRLGSILRDLLTTTFRLMPQVLKLLPYFSFMEVRWDTDEHLTKKPEGEPEPCKPQQQLNAGRDDEPIALWLLFDLSLGFVTSTTDHAASKLGHALATKSATARGASRRGFASWMNQAKRALES